MNSATVSRLQDATDEDKRDLPLRSAQEFQCLRFPPIGASQLGNNKVIGVRGSRSLNSSGVTDVCFNSVTAVYYLFLWLPHPP